MFIRFSVGVVLLAASVLVGSQALANIWETNSEIDPFTDIRKGNAWLQNSEGDPGWFGVRCIDNVLEILVWHDVQLDAEVVVTSRVGKQEPITQLWIESTTGDSLFHTRPRVLLNELLADIQHKFAVRVWTQDGHYLDSIFDTSNIDHAMNVIRKTGCLPKSKVEQ